MAIKIDTDANQIIVRTDQAAFVENEAKAAVEALKLLKEARPLVVFDFSNVREMALAALRALTRSVGATGSSPQDTKFAVVASKEICKTIREQGLDRLFACYGQLNEIVKPASGGVSKQKTLEFLNTTLEAVAHTLQVSTNTKCATGKSFVRDKDSHPVADIAATVGLVSAPFNGSLILGFPKRTYLGIMSRLLMQEYSEITPEIRDGAAELLNIILGQVKISLDEEGFAIKQAIPTVVQGDQLQILPSSNRPSVIVPYTTDVGEFYIELTTNPDSKSE